MLRLGGDAERVAQSDTSGLSSVFRAKFVDGLRKAFQEGKLVFSGSAAQLANPKRFAVFVDSLFKQRWVVYAKPAFGAPTQVLRYLGRYTHRVAISNHRLLAFDGTQVTFRWKDYAHGKKQKKMTLAATEFLRRFSQHILPRGFVRIRQFGFLANTRRATLLALARELLTTTPKPTETCPVAQSRALMRGRTRVSLPVPNPFHAPTALSY